MNDKLDNLEAELSKMQPASLQAGLAARIESRMQERATQPWADRFLLAVIGAGSLAACVIVTMLMMQSQTSVVPDVSVNVAAISPKADAAPLAFARADSAWFDAVK